MDLNQVTIPAKDVALSVKFYQNLGLKLIVDALPRYVRFECPIGNSTFSIHQADTSENKNGITLYFEVKSVEEVVANLKAKGVNFDSEIVEESWLWKEIRLSDPDQNQIKIYHAGKNRKSPPWRIKD
ncbi:VOC family protein [Winogradskyella maritima]|uniref:VOC family protein n=1 Tax=Winogradskyella maritima TaxID=1517766 RepID=A0ABV8AJX4_9FLAO|nr:VOC family protein [Winogradskyella maritima]